MSDKALYKWYTTPDKVIAIRQMVQVLCTLYFQSLTERELDMLCEIINVGEVSKDAKDSFLMNYKTSKNNVENLITRLTQKGVLVPKENIYKYRNGKRLHDKFKSLNKVINGEAQKGVLIYYDNGEK